ncbi:MAG TPA: radical SAM protein [candidate division Zixibacteria bacterium]|nr:radical SAM protein [candidate division Zixibacteria bacterium]
MSLLKACNFNCYYCLPPQFESVRKGELTKPELFKRALAALLELGVTKVRFTGGEPTLYRGLPELIAHTKRLNPDVTVALTTNARLLSRQAATLARAGLDSVNISLDTLEPEKFKDITGVAALPEVIDGIHAACERFAQVKLNVVALKGVNDTEFAELIDFANTMGVDIRFIEYMPTRYGERQQSGYMSAAEISQAIPFELTAVPRTDSAPARYYTAPELKVRIGLITSVSAPFCSSCDRLRLTSDGRLYSCLFSRRSVDCFSLIQGHPAMLAERIENLITTKRLRNQAARSAVDYVPSFSEIGG